MSETERPQIAWKAIAEDTPVFSSDGQKAGRVTRVAGDTEADIWDGLVVDVDLVGPERLLPADRVSGIWGDRIETTLTRAQIEELAPFEETPTVAWDPHQETGIEGVIHDLTRPGDELEIGQSLTRAVLFAVAWGVGAGLVADLVFDLEAAHSIWFGLLFFELILVSPRLWPWVGDVLAGVVVGVAGLIVFLSAGQGTGRSILAGVLLAVGAPLMGWVLRAAAARRTGA